MVLATTEYQAIMTVTAIYAIATAHPFPAHYLFVATYGFVACQFGC